MDEPSPASPPNVASRFKEPTEPKLGGWMRRVGCVAFALSSGRPKMDRNRRRAMIGRDDLGITSAKTDLEIVDLLELHQTPSAHWTSARASSLAS